MVAGTVEGIAAVTAERAGRIEPGDWRRALGDGVKGAEL
tara:strand:- start:316 stop:432 length:117 start_codon:yes stop_codon:yes gene_type:complete